MSHVQKVVKNLDGPSTSRVCFEPESEEDSGWEEEDEDVAMIEVRKPSYISAVIMYSVFRSQLDPSWFGDIPTVIQLPHSYSNPEPMRKERSAKHAGKKSTAYLT